MQVIEVDDVSIGRIRIVRGDDLYIGGMQLLPEYRGGGIGTKILNNLIVEAHEKNKSIKLEVFHNNPQAQKLYERVGFSVTDENDQQKIMKYEPMSAK